MRHIDRHLERHPMVKDFMGMDQDAHQFFNQDFSKHFETKINEDASKIITHKKEKKMQPHTSKNIAPK